MTVHDVTRMNLPVHVSRASNRNIWPLCRAELKYPVGGAATKPCAVSGAAVLFQIITPNSLEKPN
jgi:hypothetical protein